VRFLALPHVRPRASTLFPSTTLFRSAHLFGGDRISAAHAPGQHRPESRAHSGEVGAQESDGGHGLGRAADERDESGAESRADREDRKSTRLNSSHVKISYAVFRLKKK